jgi:transcriptional regulator GlxA family with amidase domain
MTPAKAIERLRLEAAREQVESGTEPIEAVAAYTGFADPERMRRALFGLSVSHPRHCVVASKSYSSDGEGCP